MFVIEVRKGTTGMSRKFPYGIPVKGLISSAQGPMWIEPPLLHMCLATFIL